MDLRFGGRGVPLATRCIAREMPLTMLSLFESVLKHRSILEMRINASCDSSHPGPPRHASSCNITSLSVQTASLQEEMSKV